MLKITGGEFRGRYIRTVKDRRTRYTSSKVRLALFSIVGDRIKDSHFLDLFCGSGIISIEALSRGAGFVTLVDISKRSIRCALENIRSLGLDERVEILNMDFRRAVSYLAQSQRKFDIVFADPPYNMGYCEVFLSDISDHLDLLNPDPLIILECHRREKFDIPRSFSIHRLKKFGDTNLLILKP